MPLAGPIPPVEPTLPLVRPSRSTPLSFQRCGGDPNILLLTIHLRHRRRLDKRHCHHRRYSTCANAGVSTCTTAGVSACTTAGVSTGTTALTSSSAASSSSNPNERPKRHLTLPPSLLSAAHCHLPAGPCGLLPELWRTAGLPATELHSLEFFFTALSLSRSAGTLRNLQRTQGLEFRNLRSRAYFDKQISVPTYATNHSDPFAASAPPVEPTLLLTRPSRSPIFLINNIIVSSRFDFPRLVQIESRHQSES